MYKCVCTCVCVRVSVSECVPDLKTEHILVFGDYELKLEPPAIPLLGKESDLKTIVNSSRCFLLPRLPVTTPLPSAGATYDSSPSPKPLLCGIPVPPKLGRLPGRRRLYEVGVDLGPPSPTRDAQSSSQGRLLRVAVVVVAWVTEVSDANRIFYQSCSLEICLPFRGGGFSDGRGARTSVPRH